MRFHGVQVLSKLHQLRLEVLLLVSSVLLRTL